MIDMAWASGLPQQMAIVEDPIAWYWTAPAALLLGTLIGNSLTSGVKRWKEEHNGKIWKSSETRLLGRIIAGLMTGFVWWLIGLLSGHTMNVLAIGSGLAVVGFCISDRVWDLWEWISPYLKKYVLKKLGLGG